MMTAPDFFTGQTISIKGTPHTIGSVHGDQVSYYYKRGGMPRRTTIDELNRLIEAGLATLPPDKEGRPAAPIAAVLPDLPEDERKLIDHRLQFIRAVTDQPLGAPTTRLPVMETKQRLAEVASRLGAKPPSYVTFTRWLRSYLEADGDPRSLLTSQHRRGNRTERFTLDVRALIEEATDSWLTENRKTATWVYGELVGRIIEINSMRDPDNRVVIPHYRTLVRKLKKLDPILVATKRYGKAAGERAFRSRAGGPVAHFPLERVEIDHTVLDLTVVDEDGVILGRPTFTVAIDKLTRAVVGFYVSFTPPSFLSVAQCLRHVLTDKSYLRERYPKLLNDWLVYGVPMLLVTDNGKEFLSTNFNLACEQLGVSVQLCPPRKPWFKGSVERFLGTLNEGLIHNLPGTTKSNTQDRGDYVTADHAVITEANLDYLLHRWIVDVYMQSSHSAVGTSPAAAWRRAAKINPPRVLNEAINLDVVLGMVYERSINNGRVLANGIYYHSPALTVLKAKLKPQQKVQLKLDPDDLQCVQVLNPFTREYIECESVCPNYTRGLTLHAHKTLLKRTRSQAGEDIDYEKLYRAKLELATDVKQMLKKKGKRTRKHAARDKRFAETTLKLAEADEAAINGDPGFIPTIQSDTASVVSSAAPLAPDTQDDPDGWGFEYSNDPQTKESA